MPMLPGEFGELEPYAGKWCRATENERWNERMAARRWATEARA